LAKIAQQFPNKLSFKPKFEERISEIDAMSKENRGACGSQQCLTGETCCLNSQSQYIGCCDSQFPVCCDNGGSYIGGCCNPNTYCNFLPKTNTLSGCCNTTKGSCGDVCCDDPSYSQCCPVGNGGCCSSSYPVCCSSYCCKSGASCCNWPLANPTESSSSCCDSGLTCCAGKCCSSSLTKCCLKDDKSGGQCCSSDSTCCNGACCSDSQDCNSDGTCSDKENVGAIVGGTIGAVIFVLAAIALGFLIWHCIKKRQAKWDNSANKGVELEKAKENPNAQRDNANW